MKHATWEWKRIGRVEVVPGPVHPPAYGVEAVVLEVPVESGGE